MSSSLGLDGSNFDNRGGMRGEVWPCLTRTQEPTFSDQSQHEAPALLNPILHPSTCRYLPEQIYDVVADIDNYDRFVPWCIQSRIVSQSAPDTVDAELTVGFHMISERCGGAVTGHRVGGGDG